MFEQQQPQIDWYLRNAEELASSFSKHGVPFDKDIVKKVRESSVGLAKYTMGMLLTGRERVRQGGDEPASLAHITSLALSGVKFSFKCHQFAGGFDQEATNLFDKLHCVVKEGGVL